MRTSLTTKIADARAGGGRRARGACGWGQVCSRGCWGRLGTHPSSESVLGRRRLNWVFPFAQPKGKKAKGKKVAPAPAVVKKQEAKKVVNPLFEKRPKNFGIGE